MGATFIQYVGILVAGALAILALLVPDGGKNAKTLKKWALALTILGVAVAFAGQIYQNHDEKEKQDAFRSFVKQFTTQFRQIGVSVELELPGNFSGLAPLKPAISASELHRNSAYYAQTFPSNPNSDVSKFLGFLEGSRIVVFIDSQSSTNLAFGAADLITPGGPLPEPQPLITYDKNKDVFDLTWTTSSPAYYAIQTRAITSVEDLSKARVRLEISGSPNGKIMTTFAKLKNFVLNFDQNPVTLSVHEAANSKPWVLLAYAGEFPSAEDILDFQAWHPLTNN